MRGRTCHHCRFLLTWLHLRPPAMPQLMMMPHCLMCPVGDAVHGWTLQHGPPERSREGVRDRDRHNCEGEMRTDEHCHAGLNLPHSALPIPFSPVKTSTLLGA